MSNKYNVIFLDFDGVLIPQEWEHYKSKQYDKPLPSGFDRGCIDRLNQLAHQFDAKVVLLTNWRKLFGPKACALMLAAAGYTGKFMTPEDVGEDTQGKIAWWNLDRDDNSHNTLGCPYKMSSDKCHDLHFWMDSYRDYVDRYVILEDFGLASDQTPYQVQCKLEEGFTEEKLKEAIEIFEKGPR